MTMTVQSLEKTPMSSIYTHISASLNERNRSSVKCLGSVRHPLEANGKNTKQCVSCTQLFVEFIKFKIILHGYIQLSKILIPRSRV
jgi:hypothetical protein